MKKITLYLYVLSALLAATMVISCAGGKERIEYKPFLLVPRPASLVTHEGEFLMGQSTPCYADTAFSSAGATVEMFNSFLRSNYKKIGVSLSNDVPTSQGCIMIEVDTTIAGPEGYRLEVGEQGIKIGARSDAGVFYAFQTLMQMIFPSQKESHGKLGIPCAVIDDSPAFRWRGMHLDVSRHFFPKEFIFRMLDVMAMHKLNTFHWHLTDDQGWRIEIKRYPELTERGAWRDETLIGHGSETPWVYDGRRYGGYYSQEDIREVVKYAAKLHINVVPEIEMPGHAVAALLSYPGLSCTGGPVTPFNRWGVSTDVFCAGKEETFEFLEGVLTEVAELFPYEYIHIGGDECPKERWKECPQCQKRMADNGLSTEEELQSYFVRRIENFLSSKGKKIIGWDEILEGGIAENAAVMSWRGAEGGIAAANQGHNVIMTPHSFVYLDYYQSQYNEPLSIGGLLDIKKVFSLKVMPDEIEADRRGYIMGAQANVWTEYMADQDRVEYMVLPRLAALSEVVWTNDSSPDYGDFCRRMNGQYARYDLMKLNYRVPYPGGFKPVNICTCDKAAVVLNNDIESSSMFYTLDGSEPGTGSTLYTGPVNIDLGNGEKTFKAVTVMPGGRKSAVMTGIFRQVELKRNVDSELLAQGLVYELYKGEFSTASSFSQAADTSGIIDAPGIPAGAPAENFGLVIRGLVKVPYDGIYTFYTSSDDGVILYIDGEKVVDGDTFHHGITNEGAVALMAGLHEIQVNYFQRQYRKSLSVSWEGPATERQTVNPSVLFHTALD